MSRKTLVTIQGIVLLTACLFFAACSFALERYGLMTFNLSMATAVIALIFIFRHRMGGRS